jgi:hypothetical protein
MKPPKKKLISSFPETGDFPSRSLFPLSPPLSRERKGSFRMKTSLGQDLMLLD